MAKSFNEDEDLIVLANKVIAEHGLNYMNSVKCRYLLVEPNISKTCAGKCIRASNELRHFGQADYLIEFSQDIWNSIDDQTREILMYHELQHILVRLAKGKETFAIMDHDIKEFSTIVKKFGVDWYQQFKDIVAATYELEGSDKDKITI